MLNKEYESSINDPILFEEGQETESDLKTDYLDTISDVVTWSTDWTVETVISQIVKNNIDLNPSFQRRDAWRNHKKSRFIESLIYGLPIPQIVLAEHQTSRGKFIIVDGKQRLLTLFQFCSAKSEKRFELSGLNNDKLNSLTFEKLSTEMPEYFNVFINQSIRSIIIKNWPTENFLYTIFFRLNTGSLGLSPQELRMALKPGPFLDFAEEFSKSNFVQDLLGLSEPDYRMRDLDIIIRYFSFINKISDYSGNYKQFLDNTTDYFNANWKKESNILQKQADRLKEVVEITKLIFSENAFNKYNKGKYESRINRAVFDIMSWYFFNIDIANAALKHKEKIEIKFKDLCENNYTFQKALSSNTNNLTETATRFTLWGIALKEILNFDITIPHNLFTYYNDLIK